MNNSYTVANWAVGIFLVFVMIFTFIGGIYIGYKIKRNVIRARNNRRQHVINNFENAIRLHPANQNHYMSRRQLEELRIRSNVEMFNVGGRGRGGGEGSTNVDLDNGGNRVYNRIDHSRRPRMELPGEELRVEFSNVGGASVNGREPEVRIRRPRIDRLSSESMNHVERGSPTNVQTIVYFNRGRSIKR